MNQLETEVLAELNNFNIRNTLRSLICGKRNKRRRRLNKIEKADLKALYNQITLRLFNKYERIVTNAERRVQTLINHQTRIKVHPQVWIGSRCCDLFVPIIKGKNVEGVTGKGLVIELEGPVHNLELKMKKDFSKEECLNRLGIMCMSISNDEIREETVSRVLSELKTLPRLSSPEIKRLWTEIHLETVFAYGSVEEIAKLFPKLANKIFSIFRVKP